MSKRKAHSNILFLTAFSSTIGTAATSSCTFANENIPTFKSLGYANLDNSMVKEQEARISNMGLNNLPFNVKDFDVFAKKEIKKLNDNRGFLKKLGYIYAENSLSKDTANEILTNYYNREILPKTIKSMKDDCYNNGLRQGIERGRQWGKNSAKDDLFPSASKSYEGPSFTPESAFSRKKSRYEDLSNDIKGLFQSDTVKKVVTISIFTLVAYKIYNFLFGSSKSQQQKNRSKKKHHSFNSKNRREKNNSFDEEPEPDSDDDD